MDNGNPPYNPALGYPPPPSQQTSTNVESSVSGENNTQRPTSLVYTSPIPQTSAQPQALGTLHGPTSISYYPPPLASSNIHPTHQQSVQAPVPGQYFSLTHQHNPDTLTSQNQQYGMQSVAQYGANQQVQPTASNSTLNLSRPSGYQSQHQFQTFQHPVSSYQPWPGQPHQYQQYHPAQYVPGQQYLPSQVHHLAGHGQQSPSMPSSTSGLYEASTLGTYNPYINDQSNLSASTSKQGGSSIVAGLSDLIQSKAHGYLKKIKAAQDSKSTAALRPTPLAEASVGTAAGLSQIQPNTSVFQTNQTFQLPPPQSIIPQANTNSNMPTEASFYTAQEPYLPPNFQTSPHKTPSSLPSQVLISNTSTSIAVPTATIQTASSTCIPGFGQNIPTASNSLYAASISQNYKVPTPATSATVVGQPYQHSATHSSLNFFAPPTAVQPNSPIPVPKPLAPQKPPSIPSPLPQTTTSPTAKEDGTLRNLSSKLREMTVTDSSTLPREQTDQNILEDDEPMILTSPIRATGDAMALKCTDDRIVDYEITWHYLPSTPNFLICPWCYDTYISDTGFAPNFESVRKLQAQCRFFKPRLAKALWPFACQTMDLSQVSEFIALRMTIPDCKGAGGAVMADKIKWYKDCEKEIPGFLVCQACYEDTVLGSGFASRFCENTQVQGASDKWSCDLSSRYIKFAIVKLSKSANTDGRWADFVRTVTRRMGLPKCSGLPTTASDVKWYKPKQKSADYDFCETCFMDWLALTPYGQHFEEVVHKDIQAKYSQKMCNLSLMGMMESAWLLEKKCIDFSKFLSIADTIAASPRCYSEAGIVDGKWYNFIKEVGNFGICESCYAGIIEPHGVARFFCAKPQASISRGELLCAFNICVPRSSKYLPRYVEMIETGVWSPFEDYVRKWAPILNCEKKEQVSNRAWYGWPDCTICPDCYETFATGTALVPSMPLQNTYLDAQKMCCIYSPRMREKYNKACETGNADELLTFSRERWAVYEQIVPKMNAMITKSKMENESANSNMMISTNWSCMDSLNSVWGTHTYNHYYGSDGYSRYTTSEAAASNEAWNKAMAGFDRANDPALWAEIRRLESIWLAVE